MSRSCSDERGSESLDLLAPDHQLLLREALLEGASIVTPPQPVERIGHHLVDDDVVPLSQTVRLLPESLRRCSTVRRESAEALRELVADGLVVLGRKGAASIVVEGQEQLDEMNGVSRE